MSLVLFACLVTPNKLRTLIFIKTVKLGFYAIVALFEDMLTFLHS